MKEARGDLWELGRGADAIVITTNGTVKKNGEAVMGRGCAKEAAERHPWLPKHLGARLQTKGNVVQAFAISPEQGMSMTLLSFPVKNEWWQTASLNLIVRSARDLAGATDLMKWEHVVLPRPGCGNGGLEWEIVGPRIVSHLDDRFTVVSYA